MSEPIIVGGSYIGEGGRGKGLGGGIGLVFPILHHNFH